jgi:hypothetical protein
MIDYSTLGRLGGLSRSPRKLAAVRLNGLKGGRPRSSKPRCPCGMMTARRAAARHHHCGVPAVITSDVQDWA